MTMDVYEKNLAAIRAIEHDALWAKVLELQPGMGDETFEPAWRVDVIDALDDAGELDDPGADLLTLLAESYLWHWTDFHWPRLRMDIEVVLERRGCTDADLAAFYGLGGGNEDCPDPETYFAVRDWFEAWYAARGPEPER